MNLIRTHVYIIYNIYNVYGNIYTISLYQHMPAVYCVQSSAVRRQMSDF